MVALSDNAYDYVIVGSGAGGGTLAARLAEAGMRVLVLEAGGDPRGADEPRMPADYDVPAFHPFASENPAIAWNFFVRHYADEAAQRRDPKYVTDRGGVFYPRAGTLGGCTAHNAMILIRPHDSDWDAIARLTGDPSWRAAHMSRYFRRIESCGHRPLWRQLSRLGFEPTGHGWHGWLRTEHALPRAVFHDRQLLETLIRSAQALDTLPARIARLLGIPPLMAALGRLGLRRIAPGITAEAIMALARLPFVASLLPELDDPFDPNDRRHDEGLCYTPLATTGHHRSGARERLLDVAARHPERLRVELNALATEVILDENNRAVGVAYRKGERLYRADPHPASDPGEALRVRATREVILCGGTFNTPQLLMLSGIGPRETLARHGIPTRIALDGVGRNLQDRYEVGVVNRMAADWSSLAKARFRQDDPLFQEWAEGRGSMYESNGTMLAVARRSTETQQAPDLFCMALLARFAGYFPGYARDIADHHDYLTWAILKAHTVNRAGEVTLRSSDPRDMPAVNFRYFEEGDDSTGQDLRAVVEAIRFVRRLAAPLREAGLVLREELPGLHLESDAELAQFVRDHAWGHHASCTCAIGPRAEGGVLDSAFRVHSAAGLRVVDASVFPRIPGFFIASAVYMIAEKAADVMLAEANG